MKRLIAILLSLTLGLSIGGFQLKEVDAKVSELSLTVHPSVKNIKLVVAKDADSKKASYFKFYRATCTRKYVNKHYTIPKKKYKFLKKSYGRTYVDNKAKKGKIYFYYVKAFNKKGKLIGKDINRNCSYEYRIGNPGTPRIDNAYVDDYRSTSKKIYIEVSSDPHATAAWSFIVYKKKKGAKKYKKLKTIKVSKSERKEWFTSAVFSDKKVKPKGKYLYKAKVMSKVNGKKYYSKMSKPVEAWAVNCDPNYKVDCLTKAGDDVNEAVIKLENADKGNAPSLILASGYTYEYQKTKNSKSYRLAYEFTDYSYDNKEWKKIPKGDWQSTTTYLGKKYTDMGGVLLDDKPLYIKIKLSAENEEYGIQEKLDQIPFGGKTAYISNLEVYENIRVFESGYNLDGAEGGIDLTTGKGNVHYIGAD